jgi:transposase
VKVIVAMLDDPKLHAALTGLKAGLSVQQSGITCVRRFDAEGLASLEDKPKSKLPPTHDQRVRSELINLALRRLNALGHPFKLWTLQRLQSAFQERQGVHLSD